MNIFSFSLTISLCAAGAALAGIPSSPYSNEDLLEFGRQREFSGVRQTHMVPNAKECRAFMKEGGALNWEGWCTAVAVKHPKGETFYLTAAHCLPRSGCIFVLPTAQERRPLLSPSYAKHFQYEEESSLGSLRAIPAHKDLAAFIGDWLPTSTEKRYPLYEGDIHHLINSPFTYHAGFGVMLNGMNWENSGERQAMRVTLESYENGVFHSSYLPEYKREGTPSGTPTSGDSGGGLFYYNKHMNQMELVGIYSGSKHNGDPAYYKDLPPEGHLSHHEVIKEESVGPICEEVPCYGRQSAWAHVTPAIVEALYKKIIRGKTAEAQEKWMSTLLPHPGDL